MTSHPTLLTLQKTKRSLTESDRMWSWVLTQAQKTEERKREKRGGARGEKSKDIFTIRVFCNIFADTMFLYIVTYYLLNFIKKIKIFTEKGKCISSHVCNQ